MSVRVMATLLNHMSSDIIIVMMHRERVLEGLLPMCIVIDTIVYRRVCMQTTMRNSEYTGQQFLMSSIPVHKNN